MTAEPVFDPESGVLRLAPRHWAALAGVQDESAWHELEQAGAISEGRVAPPLAAMVEGLTGTSRRLQVEVRRPEGIRAYAMTAGPAGILVVREGDEAEPTDAIASPVLDDLPSALAVLLGLGPRPAPEGRPAPLPVPPTLGTDAAGEAWYAPVTGATPACVMVVEAPEPGGDLLVAADLGDAGWWLGRLPGGEAGDLYPASATDLWGAFSLLLWSLEEPPSSGHVSER